MLQDVLVFFTNLVNFELQIFGASSMLITIQHKRITINRETIGEGQGTLEKLREYIKAQIVHCIRDRVRQGKNFTQTTHELKPKSMKCLSLTQI